MKYAELVQRERLELALRASNEGVWLWDLENNEINYSEKVLNFIGYSKEEAPHIFSNLIALYHAEDALKLQEKLDHVFSPDGPDLFGENCRFHHPSGTWRWLRIRGACVRDEDKKVIRLAGSIIDITKRKIAEKALEEERHLLNLLIESIPVNVYFKDEDSKFVISNTATSSKMGLKSRDELVGKSDHNFFSSVHADQSRKDEVMIMYTREKIEGALEKETWEGQVDSWCITSKHPWLDNNGKVKGTFGVTNDVSDIVDTQTRLVNVARELKQRNEDYEEELSLANEVQQSILVKNIPSLRSDGFNVHFYPEYHPMDGLAGDFYDVVNISDTKTGILMCDVMGHGTRAALIVAMLRGLISKEAAKAEHPDAFLFGLNQGLTKIMHRAAITMFATAIYVVIDSEKGSLSFADAGHPLPIIKKKGVYQQLDLPSYESRPALGLLKETIYQPHVLSLKDVDECLLFTDGIYEIVDSNENELGIDGVIKLMQKESSSEEPTQTELLKSLRAYGAGRRFNDDVCMLNIVIEK